jgi:(1->4)-alpha-D-glucan 1-alpha-D-glucosylmutase
MPSASEFGIEMQYHDAWGVLRMAPNATVMRLVEALKSVTPEDVAVGADASDDHSVHCFRPNWMESERLWGIGVQFYGIRSQRNWGIGDFTDLSSLIAMGAAVGADFIGVSPLHALYAADPFRFSPYSPSSREFLNVLFVDPTAMLAYACGSAARRAIDEASFQRHLVELRNAEFVDYAGVAACKDRVFRLIYEDFEATVGSQSDHPLAIAFDRFRRERSEPLRRFAIFQALSCRPGFGPNWRTWPEDYRDPASARVAEFAASNESETLYHAYLQWEADTQLSKCAAVARGAGMRIGLYLDLAVGTDPGSVEGWDNQRDVIPGFHVGAPPDLWNQAGQDWGLSARDPFAFMSSGSAGYRRVLGAVMRHAGAIRIDHVLGFHRLFLVAAGGSAEDGVYLRMPEHRLCRLLAEESVARQCVVIGEDLGTVPAGFQALMARYGILSYRLLIFGKDGSRYLAPGEYPPEALVAVGTHDLPPLLAFWSGSDLAVRTSLGLFPDEMTRQLVQAERAADRQAMRDALAAAGRAVGEDATSLMVAAHGFLARTPCRLFLAQMEDLAMESAQPNLPGSDERYPSWRRKLTRNLDAIFSDERTAAMLAAIRAERPSGPRQ